nr:MAG TPA: tail protein [Caudoviricetes sp.]
MAFEVNSKYGELMSSAKWNKRFDTIYGANVVMRGYDIQYDEENSRLILSPGNCIVNGAEITCDTETYYPITSTQLTENSSIRLVLSYIHQPTKVDVEIKEDHYELLITDIVLGTAIIEDGEIVEIVLPEKTPSLTEIITYLRENPGDKIFNTIEERDSYPEKKRYIGFSCFVIETLLPYYYEGNGVWRSGSSNAVHIGPDEPINDSMLWVDDEDEEIEENFGSDILNQLKVVLGDMNAKIENVEYALTKELDPGYFGGKMPGEDDETEEEETTISRAIDLPGEAVDPEYPPLGDGEVLEEPDIDKGAEGTVETILLKRGLKKDLPMLMEGELGLCIDTEELYVGLKGSRKLLAKVGGVGGGSGTSNVTAQYIELISTSGKKFRVRVNEEGKLYSLSATADTANKPSINDAANYSGLIINHVYGGGERNTNLTPCSHGFIELYNKGVQPINLRGLYIQYCPYGTDWQVLELHGIVNPLCSFLIRCAEHTDIHRKTTKFKISNYDMHWDIALTDKGMKVYLGINPEPLTVANPCSIDGQWAKQPGYIDLFVVGSDNVIFPMDAYERNPSVGVDGFQRVANIFHSAHRIDFADTNTSLLDIEGIDLRTADPTIYYPRYTGDGQWINYYNKLKLYDHKPNMINMCFGQDGNKTRTFTWQTTPTINGFLKYKKVGDSRFKTIESTKQEISHYDTNAVVHRVILRDLAPGKYVYYCGEEGKWSDQYEFTVKTPTINDRITFLHTTDQQGINEEEYVVWKKAHAEILKHHTYDFHINTGDISNDGGEFAYQWRYYYNFADMEDLYSKPHMTCCGNNDLTRDFATDGKKRDPEAFAWYTTTENNFMVSCHSWNYGYIHFVCLNSNTLIDKQIAKKQIPWLREDLAKPENKKRWTIVYMHEAPYTIIKQQNMAPFIDVFAEFGVDLVLCGHHHRYSRSHRMGAQAADGSDQLSDTGFYTIMCQAAGAKLMGRAIPADNDKAPWRAKWDVVGNPAYSIYEITKESISMKTYAIANILPDTDTSTNSPERSLVDSFVISKPL